MPRIKEAENQLVFLRKLQTSTRSCQHPTSLEYFTYPAADAKTASFSAVVLKTFQPIWFCKDYLFLNQDWFEGVAWLSGLFWTLLGLLIVSFLMAIAMFRRLRQTHTIALE
jgi:hypothetical protein